MKKRDEQAISNRKIVGLVATLIVGCTVVQILITRNGHVLAVQSKLVLAAVAVYYFAFIYIVNRKQLMRRRYGAYLVHVLTYLIVNGSYWLHAGFLVATDRANLLDSQWYGVLFGMSIFWGIGLALHTFGTLMSKGFEDARF